VASSPVHQVDSSGQLLPRIEEVSAVSIQEDNLAVTQMLQNMSRWAAERRVRDKLQIPGYDSSQVTAQSPFSATTTVAEYDGKGDTLRSGDNGSDNDGDDGGDGCEVGSGDGCKVSYEVGGEEIGRGASTHQSF
jgi:hypothetical protein